VPRPWNSKSCVSAGQGSGVSCSVDVEVEVEVERVSPRSPSCRPSFESATLELIFVKRRGFRVQMRARSRAPATWQLRYIDWVLDCKSKEQQQWHWQCQDQDTWVHGYVHYLSIELDRPKPAIPPASYMAESNPFCQSIQAAHMHNVLANSALAKKARQTNLQPKCFAPCTLAHF